MTSAEETHRQWISADPDGLFGEYQAVQKLLAQFYALLRTEGRAKELVEVARDFERRYRPGDTTRGALVSDSVYVEWLLFDCAFGKPPRTALELFQDEVVPKLNPPGPDLAENVRCSHMGFFQMKEYRKDWWYKFEEIYTGAAWNAFDPDHPGLEPWKPGQTWFVRLVGPRDAAMCFTQPMYWDELEKATLRAFIDHVMEKRGEKAKHEIETLAKVMKADLLWFIEQILLSERLDKLAKSGRN